MPTNLPPDYFEAEAKYRAATSPEDKISWLQEMLRIMPKHKGTDKLRADLRKRLSKLKSAAQAKKKVGRRESAFQIDREGAGQVVVIGPPNVGKSSLVATLTNATPEVADFPYTTWDPTPGMMPLENIQIQLIDTPPLNQEFVDPELLNLVRRADLVLLILDLRTDPLEQLAESVALLREHRIVPQHQKAHYDGERRPVFVPLLVLVNKYDGPEADELWEIFQALLEGEWPLLPISTKTGHNLETLKWTVFERLRIIRVYSKAPGQDPNRDQPFILERGSTVEEFAGKVHQDFAEHLKTARLWGSATYDGLMVPRDYVLQDGDVVELHM